MMEWVDSLGQDGLERGVVRQGKGQGLYGQFLKGRGLVRQKVKDKDYMDNV